MLLCGDMDELEGLVPPWVTPRQAAKALGIKHRTLVSWIERGDIPRHKLGGKLIIYRSELEAYIKKGLDADA